MRNFIFLVASVMLISCKENNDYEIFSFSISNINYKYDLESGVFEIPGIKFSDTVNLSSNQKNKIKDAFFKFHIDTLNGKKTIVSKRPVIMPDIRDVITIKINGREKSELSISNIKDATSENYAIDIYKFREELFYILNQNSRFRERMDILQENYENLPPAM